MRLLGPYNLSLTLDGVPTKALDNSEERGADDLLRTDNDALV